MLPLPSQSQLFKRLKLKNNCLSREKTGYESYVWSQCVKLQHVIILSNSEGQFHRVYLSLTLLPGICRRWERTRDNRGGKSVSLILRLFDFKSLRSQSKHICIIKTRNALWHALSKTDILPDV